MALEFLLHIVTDRKEETVLRYLSNTLGFKESKEDNCIIGPGVVVDAIEATTRRQSLIMEKFHFSPTMTVWFRIQPKESYSKGKESVLYATRALLKEIASDGVLLFNGEDIVVQSINGQLVFNEEFGDWDRPKLDELLAGLSYEIRKLPSPFR